MRPNDEHVGLGDVIRKTRQENLKTAIVKRHAYYKSTREVVPDYGLTGDRGSSEILEPIFAAGPAENAGNEKTTASCEAERRDDFQVNSLGVLCQNR